MLAAWEEGETDAVVDRLNKIGEPEERLRALIRSAFDERRGARIEGSLQADGENLLVAAVLRRATARKESTLRDLFNQINADPPGHRSLLAYSAYLGLVQLRRSAPAVVPSGPELTRFIDQTIEWLVG